MIYPWFLLKSPLLLRFPKKTWNTYGEFPTKKNKLVIVSISTEPPNF